MTRKIAVLTVIWLTFISTEYFLLPYFVKPFSWLLFCAYLIILLIRQIVKIIKEKKLLNQYAVSYFLLTVILFILTFYNFNKIPDLAVEKIDWLVSREKRNQIVEEVELGKLKQNTKMNNGVCELSFMFPIVSNGGNDILIYENKNEKTVKFWISRGFFESPQTYFVYTSDAEVRNHYKNLIKAEPEYNWQIEGNWYRIMERD